MEGGSLFNPGFLGGSFLWWVGQIADDSTWRDNISTGIYQSKYSIPGWGRRYKVRIIGLHDQGETAIPSEQLPWAQVMYPITGGGGQTNSAQTSNLRQGMFVFGFFLDGQDQQVPVIMGVLGNNSQTSLATNWNQVNKVTNESPGSLAISGYAEGKEPKSRETKEKVPDYGKEIEKPKDAEVSSLCAAPPPEVKLNKYGLRPDIPQSDFVYQLAQSARAELETNPDLQSLTKLQKEEYVQQKVAEGIKQQCAQANAPGSPARPGATIEQTDSVHKLNAEHVKREDKLQEKIPLMKPTDKVGSALRNIQVVLDNLLQKIDKYLNAITSYIDAVTSNVTDLSSLILIASQEISKYLKIVFDKVMEYVMKQLNKELTKVVSATPSTMRYLIGDVKEVLTELILCLYGKITSGLSGLIESLLNQAIKPEELEERANQAANNPNPNRPLTSPKVPMCYAEELVGNVLSYNKQEIENANNTMFDNVNTLLNDIQSQIAGVTDDLADITSLLGDINGSLSSALSFNNINLNVFGCEIKPNVAVSDFYTFARGGASQPDSEQPSAKGVENAAAKESTAQETAAVPFVEPTRATSDVILTDSRTVEQILSATSGIA